MYTILLTFKTSLTFKKFSNFLPDYGIKILYLLIFIFLIEGNLDFKFSCYIFPHEKQNPVFYTWLYLAKHI